MPRSEFSSPRREPSVFLNRTDELHSIGSHIDLLQVDPTHFRVFEVVGLGGVGKTRLLNELRSRAEEDKRTRPLVWTSLEAEASASETGPLLAIREQVDIDCLLFDAALLTYWKATGQPLQIAPSSRIARSLAFKTLDVGRSVAGIPLPLAYAADVYEAIGRKVTKIRRYRKEEFEAIDALRLDPSAIRTRLPHFLGIDIKRRLESANESLVVFYDAYDRQASSTITAKAHWLREFVGTVDRGLHVISTRDPLGWDDVDWSDVVQPVFVDRLPERHSRELVRTRLGALAPQVEDRILEASHRIPFFLEAVIDAYEHSTQRGEQPQEGDLPRSPDTAVAYLLDHLPVDHRRIAIALAAVQAFDESLYRHLIRAFNLQLSTFDFDAFIEWFFVEEVSAGFYKTHDLLTAFVRESASEESVRLAALQAATEHFHIRSQADGLSESSRFLSLAGALIAGWSSTTEMPLGSVEKLVDAGYLLYDAGYWKELASMASESGQGLEHPIGVVASFFTALALRRTEGIEPALRLFERMEPTSGLLGRHAASMQLEASYLSEIAGNYSRARTQFRELAEQAVPFNANDRTHLRSRLYHADMLIMDGSFKEGSRLLLETYESAELGATDWAELVRHRAHAFRFSFLLERAEDLYVRALSRAPDAPALIGKLHTNLAEARCWHDPEGAMEAAGLSSELNLRLGNQIEIAKCDATRGIALARLGESRAAADVIGKATRTASEIGYPAGSAFSLQARAISLGLAGNRADLRRAIEALSHEVKLLGTYSHLMVAPLWLAGSRDAFGEAAARPDWLEEESLESRLASYLSP